jgi:hypothetical protein
MALTANDVIARATLLLNDKGNAVIGVAANTRWSVAELLEWVSDAQRQIVLMRPNALNVVAKVPLASGTRQTIPADGWLMLGATRNLTAAGGAGRAVREVKRDVLDAFNPDWHTDTATPAVKNYLYDVQDQRAFYVYPPNDGTGNLEVNYSGMPVQLTDVTSPLQLDQIYLTPMVDYTCFRALSKDAEFAGGASLASQFLAAFNAAIMGRDQAEKEDSPDATFSPPGSGNYQPPGR